MLKPYWEDLRCAFFIPKSYKPPTGMDEAGWRAVMRRYANMGKTISCSAYHWRIITYDDGRRELAFLRVLKGGFFSGKYPAIYRGILIPRRIGYVTFAHITDIRLAF